MPLPGLQQRIGFAQEKYLAMPGVVRVGKNDQPRSFLLDSGQIEQVGIDDRFLRSIGVGDRRVVGIDYCKASGRKQSGEPFAIFHEKLRRDGFVAHVARQYPNSSRRVNHREVFAKSSLWSSGLVQ